MISAASIHSSPTSCGTTPRRKRTASRPLSMAAAARALGMDVKDFVRVVVNGRQVETFIAPSKRRKISAAAWAKFMQARTVRAVEDLP